MPALSSAIRLAAQGARRGRDFAHWQMGRWAYAAVLAACFFVAPSSRSLCIAVAVLTLAAASVLYRLNFNSAWVAFAAPWAIVLLFSALDISEYAREVTFETVGIVALGLAVAAVCITPNARRTVTFDERPMVKRRFAVIFAIFAAFTALNVAMAGYVPLIQALTTGESGYMEFGVKGVYGLYNAFTNAFGLTAFYFWMRDGDRLYRNALLATILVFLLFFTRQNLVSLAIECFVTYSLCVKRISPWRLGAGVAVGLFLFGVAGDLRIEGAISELANIKSEYAWLPNAFVWLYSYSYFNILNLDNVVTSFPLPAFDGSSLFQLIPSFLRPGDGVVDDSLLEVSSFNVTSYASPIFRDFGLAGVVIVVAMFSMITRRCLSRAQRDGSFAATTSYAVLYFCFALSFFVNFWFYLPIIFQPVFLWLFGRTILRRRRPGRSTPTPGSQGR
jgi:oligosaccharide repeat unit polymerase